MIINHSFFHREIFCEGIQKYQNNPTSTGLATKDYPIMNIEFPGITICPNTKVVRLGKLLSPPSFFFSQRSWKVPSELPWNPNICPGKIWHWSVVQNTSTNYWPTSTIWSSSALIQEAWKNWMMSNWMKSWTIWRAMWPNWWGWWPHPAKEWRWYVGN